MAGVRESGRCFVCREPAMACVGVQCALCAQCEQRTLCAQYTTCILVRSVLCVTQACQNQQWCAGQQQARERVVRPENNRGVACVYLRVCMCACAHVHACVCEHVSVRAHMAKEKEGCQDQQQKVAAHGGGTHVHICT